MAPKETIPNDEVTITDWFRILSLEEGRQSAPPKSKTKLLHELVRGKTGTFSSAAAPQVRV